MNKAPITFFMLPDSCDGKTIIIIVDTSLKLDAVLIFCDKQYKKGGWRCQDILKCCRIISEITGCANPWQASVILNFNKLRSLCLKMRNKHPGFRPDISSIVVADVTQKQAVFLLWTIRRKSLSTRIDQNFLTLAFPSL